MLGGTEDLADAYRHVPTADPRMTCFATADPTTGEPKYFTLPGFNFGLKAAVPQFNRFPEAMTAIARRLTRASSAHTSSTTTRSSNRRRRQVTHSAYSEPYTTW